MSQKAFLRDFDMHAAVAFGAAGLSDAAIYTAPGGGVSQPCRVLVDRGVQQWGDEPLTVAATDITVAFLAPSFAPVKGGTVVVDGDTYRLTDKLGDDGSLVRFAVVAHG
ncbi:hypothetical protein H7691_06725 [Stenotrophomonas sp. CW117]|uniref:head-tail joining protein n=1 Tax=Stenotrophomonas TaxID=40323 RepID=UPI00178088E9|nr:hypothetical protein [Stenotrophomonas sp. CW117]QOF99800.1 hypothetical protein H7691_06725 [Stenotrophomonas sp. CW117]